MIIFIIFPMPKIWMITTLLFWNINKIHNIVLIAKTFIQEILWYNLWQKQELQQFLKNTVLDYVILSWYLETEFSYLTWHHLRHSISLSWIFISRFIQSDTFLDNFMNKLSCKESDLLIFKYVIFSFFSTHPKPFDRKYSNLIKLY